QRTLRIANGFAGFVRAVLAELGETLTVGVAGLDEADPADREVLAVLERRLPGLVTVVTAESPARPPGGVPGFARIWDGGTAAETLTAVEWCLDRGCHHAVAELAGLGLERAEGDGDVWWGLVHHLAVALGSLEREEEAEAVLAEARARTTDPVRHSTMAYTSAMLVTRHHLPARRDLAAALGWVNVAIALCGLLPEPESRAVKLGFDLNGKALIMARLGRMDEALELVEAAMRLADELPGDAQPIHRLVLRVNRAQLRIKAGDRAGALADLDAAITADPGYPDYYVDRGNLLFALGRHDDALADYETALRDGPPFAEAYYNRSEVLFARGDLKAALDDLDTALELDPSLRTARANRAGLLVALGEPERARPDVTAALHDDPANPYLLCVLGQIEGAAGHYPQARAAFDQAVAGAPSLAMAWAGRGVLAFDSGGIHVDGEGTVIVT
ncbi:tetratricopeptide repeat protein, partial [Actinocorallia lasiicapitis]